MELIELDAEMTEAEEMQAAFDALSRMAEGQAEIIRNLRADIERLNAIIEHLTP